MTVDREVPSTMTSIAILIPVLERPHRVAPLIESIQSSAGVIELRPVFLVSPHDELEKAELVDRDDCVWFEMPFAHGPGDYARKMNYGFDFTEDEFLFLAADDLAFHRGWAETAVGKHLETEACVVGTNDLGNYRVTSGQHSTHSLVHRDYGECGTIDEKGKLLHEGYTHNFVDDEFVETAKWRSTYAHASDAHVEHLHPHWGKGQDDAIYRLAERTFAADRSYHAQRRRLWT